MQIRSRSILLFLAIVFVAAAPLTAASTPAVVSAAVLDAQLSASPGTVAVIDARPTLKEYLSGHIPGAQPLMVENLRSASAGVPATLFPWETLDLIVHRLGLVAARPVVVYGGESGIDATYVASVLRLTGITQVAVLDGGFERWTAEKRPVTRERKVIAASKDTLLHDATALVGIDEVKAAVEKRSALLLDVRPADQFAAGHIPGARNRFWAKDVVPAGQPDAGSFRGEAEIRAELEALGAV